MKRADIGIAAMVGSLFVAAIAGASRPATSAETVLLNQAVFDYYFSNSALSSEQITHVKVDVLAGPAALGSRLVTKYAAITVHARDTSGQDVGYALAVAVYYSSPSPGWHIYNDGSAEVGCSDKWYPPGMRRTIMRSLGLTCPA